ncbi:hypothetical protein LIER_31989 [Lithospermum erythrorhizon]|uniref:Disease resistance R13L4/SHOC-2-like LRR domain-containing protein n=1 Tax=Lithospermum erythrorhizon TaxID=34254 RepID=A0AAV3RSM5_LITER
MCFQLEVETSNWNVMLKNARHVSVDYSAIHLSRSNKFKNPKLRTLKVVDKNQSKRGNEERPRFDIPSDMMKKMGYLRVFVLCDYGIVELSKNIKLLEHLRCLNLSHNTIEALSDEVCKLLALQILKLRKCNDLKNLPKDLTKLVNLHQLDIDIGNLTEKSSQLGKLTVLQFLEKKFVQNMNGHRIEEYEISRGFIDNIES